MVFEWPPRVNLNVRLDNPMVLAGTWVLFLPWVLFAIHDLVATPERPRSVFISLLVAAIGLFAGAVLLLVTRKFILLRRRKRVH